MKTIQIELQVPDWARWIATDKNGAIRVYDTCPLKTDNIWYTTIGISWLVGTTTDLANWEQSLRPI